MLLTVCIKDHLFILQSAQHTKGKPWEIGSAHADACSCVALRFCLPSACSMTSMGRALRANLKPCSAIVQIADFGMSRVLAHNKSHVSTDTHGAPYICHQLRVKIAA